MVAHKIRRYTGALVVAALLAGACTTLPTQELSDARQAIAAAREVGAEVRAADQLAEAQALLHKAEAAMQNGDYDLSRDYAIDARAAAVNAQKQAHQSPQYE